MSTNVLAEEGECININNNKICFSSVKNEKTKFNKFNKKEYDNIIINNSKKAIERSKIIAYTYASKVALEDAEVLWNNTVNKSISGEYDKNQLLDFMLGVRKNTKDVPLNKILEYISSNIFSIRVNELNKKIFFNFHVNENYIDSVWDDIKPNGRCKRQNTIDYFYFFDGLKYKRDSLKNSYCISPYPTKDQLLNFLNNDISQQVNNYIKLFPEINIMALNLYHYGKNRLIPKLTKIKYVNRWFKNTYISEGVKYKRKVFLLNSFPFDNTAPWIDNGIGNLYLLNKDYAKLKEKNLFGYLMMHEAEHIKMNLEGSMSNYFTGEIPKFFEAICKDNINGVVAKDLCGKKYEYERIENSFEQKATEIFENNDEDKDKELIIDINIISRLPAKERNYYIDMLELLMPTSKKRRIDILKDYVSSINEFEKIDLSYIDQETLFLLLQLKEERRGTPDVVDTIWSVIDPSKNDKRTSDFIKKTINIDRISQIRKQYMKMSRSKSLYILRDKIYSYVNNSIK